MSDTTRVACCGRRVPFKDAHSITRTGGGTYRRGGRGYDSSICIECATALVGGRTEPDYAMQKTNRYPMRRLIQITIKE